MKLFPATVQQRNIHRAELLLQKSRAFCVWRSLKRRSVSNIYRWRFPLPIHCESPSAPVAFENQANRRAAEDPAAANGQDGEDGRPSLLYASPLRTDSLSKWMWADYFHRSGQSGVNITHFFPKSDVFVPQRPPKCTVDVRFVLRDKCANPAERIRS